jgi:hypothetical protein
MEKNVAEASWKINVDGQPAKMTENKSQQQKCKVNKNKIIKIIIIINTKYK